LDNSFGKSAKSKLVQYPIYISPNYLDESLLKHNYKGFYFLSGTALDVLKDFSTNPQVTIGVDCDNINDKTAGTKNKFGDSLLNNSSLLAKNHPNVFSLNFSTGEINKNRSDSEMFKNYREWLDKFVNNGECRKSRIQFSIGSENRSD